MLNRSCSCKMTGTAPEIWRQHSQKRRTVHVRRQRALSLVLRVGLQPGSRNRPVARDAFFGRWPLELVPILDFAILPHCFAACNHWLLNLLRSGSLAYRDVETLYDVRDNITQGDCRRQAWRLWTRLTLA